MLIYLISVSYIFHNIVFTPEYAYFCSSDAINVRLIPINSSNWISPIPLFKEAH